MCLITVNFVRHTPTISDCFIIIRLNQVLKIKIVVKTMEKSNSHTVWSSRQNGMKSTAVKIPLVRITIHLGVSSIKMGRTREMALQRCWWLYFQTQQSQRIYITTKIFQVLLNFYTSLHYLENGKWKNQDSWWSNQFSKANTGTTSKTFDKATLKADLAPMATCQELHSFFVLLFFCYKTHLGKTSLDSLTHVTKKLWPDF